MMLNMPFEQLFRRITFVHIPSGCVQYCFKAKTQLFQMVPKRYFFAVRQSRITNSTFCDQFAQLQVTGTPIYIDKSVNLVRPVVQPRLNIILS